MASNPLRILALATSLFSGLAVNAQAANLVHGGAVYKKAGCFQCHPGGENVIMPAKPIKGAKFADEFKDDQVLIKVIRTGIKGTPMPGFGKEKISDAEMADLVAYIRSLSQTKSK